MKLKDIKEEHGNEIKKLMVQYTFTVHKYVEIDIVDFENHEYDNLKNYVAELDRVLRLMMMILVQLNILKL